MAEQEEEKKKAGVNKRTRRWLWCAAVFLILGLIALGLSWKSNLWDSQSAEEKLAAIEAGRAIPDAQNAAAAYRKFAENRVPFAGAPHFLTRDAQRLTIEKPWPSKDYPDLAAWLKQYEGLISKPLEMSKIEECRFPIPSDTRQISSSSNPVRHMRGWVLVIVRSANNDVAEDRIETAIEQYACVMRMANHLRQQLVLVYYNNGAAMELLPLDAMKAFIIQTKLTEKQLQEIQAALLPPENKWKEQSERILEVERLLEQKQRGRSNLRATISYWWDRIRRRRFVDELHRRTYGLHLRTLANRRGTHILIALKSHRNETGRWPQSLNEVKSSLSKETLTDPYNGSSFVYKLTDDGFKLYSRGDNDVDEGCKGGGGVDDWPIWPPIDWKTALKGTNVE